MQILLDDPRAEYGIGLESLRAAVERWAHAGHAVTFCNASRNDTFRDCEIDHYWSHVHGGTGVVAEGTEPHHALVIGSAVHAAIEHLLGAERGSRAASEVVGRAAAAARAYVRDAWGGDDVPLQPRNHEEREAFHAYLPDLLAAGGKKLDAVDRVLATEEMVWALVPVGHEFVCFMGTPDAIIVQDGGVYHLQHKTRGRESGYDSYLVKLAFGSHETAYGAILRRLLARGALGGGGVQDLPYRGSIVGLWLKQARPDDTLEPLPKGLTDAADKGHVTIAEDPNHDGHYILARQRCTDKQWEKVRSLMDNWSARDEKRREQIRSYDERAVQLLPVDLDDEKMDLGFRRVLLSIWRQWEIDMAVEPNLDWVGNPKACDRWGSPCRWIESKTCGGWEDYDLWSPDSGWTHRPPDYVDEVRKLYSDLFAAAREEEMRVENAAQDNGEVDE